MVRKKAALIFQVLKDYIWSDELKIQGRMSTKDFIRERVLGLPILVLFLINLAKKTLQVSLNEFCRNCDLVQVTKQAFSKARKKLSPRTFILLNEKLLEEFYTDNVFSTWNEFRLIAIDGSDIQLPSKKKIEEIYGTAKNQTGSTLAMAKISYAYDVLNHLTMDVQIDIAKYSERDLAIKHIASIKKRTLETKIKNLYIFDRGYPSLGMLFYLCNDQEDFLMRCTISSCFGKVKKELGQGKTDEVIRLYAVDAIGEQIAELKNRAPSVNRKQDYIDVRMVVVTLSTGEKELLITSLLDQTKYPASSLKELYHKRWGAEENYKWHKVAFQLENFAGHTKLAIEQELFAVVLTANMASLLIQEAQGEVEEEHKAKSLKHEYKINRRVAIPILRTQLLTGLLDPSINMDELCNFLKVELKKNLCPVRSNRSFERPKKGRLKYGCTTRNCI